MHSATAIPLHTLYLYATDSATTLTTNAARLSNKTHTPYIVGATNVVVRNSR